MADSVQHYTELKPGGISFLDIGTSGGAAGARHGACFMVGGDKEAFAKVEPLLRDLAVPDGLIHAGPSGAGHFVKLIHNAIEFGMVQAMAEGVDLLTRSDYQLDLPALFHTWNRGSVIRSWLVELMESGLRENKLDDLSSYVEDTREVKWAVEYAMDKEAWIPVTALSELAFYRTAIRTVSPARPSPCCVTVTAGILCTSNHRNPWRSPPRGSFFSPEAMPSHFSSSPCMPPQNPAKGSKRGGDRGRR